MSDEETWLEALATYEKLAMGRRKVELTSIIRPILEQLQREAQTVVELRASYHAGDEWWLQYAGDERWLKIARTGYPDQPRLWDKHRTADVAYGIRYRQLVGQAPERA
jgi:hypothetical protein